MRLKIENLGPGPIMVRDRFGDLRELYAGEVETFIGPVQGRLIDDQPGRYRCTPVE